MKSQQRFPHAQWRNCEPEKRELRGGNGSTAVLSKTLDDRRVYEDSMQCACNAVVSDLRAMPS